MNRNKLMFTKVIKLTPKNKDYPKKLTKYFGIRAPKNIYLKGDIKLLNKTLVGILSSRKVTPHCILESYKVIDNLSKQNIVFISGWSSPLEEDLLRKISKTETAIGVFLAKGIKNYEIKTGIQSKLNKGKAIVLTHCIRDVKRITRNSALRRNNIVIAMSDIVFIGQAEKGSGTFKLATEAIRKNKKVYTLDNDLNNDLLKQGAIPFDFKIISFSKIGFNSMKREQTCQN